MNLLELSDDILEKVFIELKYIGKQKYYDKCKVWLMKEVSNLMDIGYYIEVEKSFKTLDKHGHYSDIDNTHNNKIHLHNELKYYFFKKYQ
jgi:hypothetical protein